MLPSMGLLPDNAASAWFRASEAAGEFMGIRYGFIPHGSAVVDWHYVSHVECDGIGGFARLLRARGAGITELPETKHPCRAMLGPLWRLWRDSRRQGECAGRGDWSVVAQPGAGTPKPVAWHLFSEEQTGELASQCRDMRVTMNSFLLKKLDQAVRPEIRRPQAAIPWMVPVNLRGDIRHPDDTENHVSCVGVRIAPEESVEEVNRQVLHRLGRGEHRANHLLLIIGGFLSHAAKVRLLEKDRAKAAGNIGAFSNLGVWNHAGESETGGHWVFCPPVVNGQLLGAGCVTYRGRLGLAIQVHPAQSPVAELADRCMGRWVASIVGVR